KRRGMRIDCTDHLDSYWRNLIFDWTGGVPIPEAKQVSPAVPDQPGGGEAGHRASDQGAEEVGSVQKALPGAADPKEDPDHNSPRIESHQNPGGAESDPDVAAGHSHAVGVKEAGAEWSKRIVSIPAYLRRPASMNHALRSFRDYTGQD